MRHTTRRAAALGLVAALAIAGCADGDSTDEATTDAAGDGGVTADPVGDDADGYLAAVEERCAQVNEEISALEEEFPEETPEDAVGYLAGWADAVEGFVTDVEDMEAPAELADGTDEVLAALTDVATAFRGAAEEIEGGAEDVDAAAGAAFASLGPAEVAAGEQWEISLESCGEEQVVADADAAQVAVTATDYAFEIPDVTAGPTAFTMTNEGEEPHFMVIVKMKEGATVAEALEAEAAGEDPEAFIEEDIGESTTAPPGMTAVVNADLTPGTYGMLCFVSTADGTPHAALGMAQEFVVE